MLLLNRRKQFESAVIGPKTGSKGIDTARRSHAFLVILWATPSAAGPRSLLIASGLEILGIVASGSWYFWDANLSFGMIGGFTLAFGGTLGRFWETGEHNTRNLRVQARSFT